MRFSLRWILAATAYVAVAAAAFTQTNWIYADILWALSLLAVVFALLLACFARGKRQVKAAGFVFAIAGYLLCLQFGGVPTARLLTAAGIGQSAPNLPTYYPPGATLNLPSPRGNFVVPAVDVQLYPGSFPALPNTSVDNFPIYLRAGNAVGMMAFGLLGCLVGALAFRAASVKSAV